MEFALERQYVEIADEILDKFPTVKVTVWDLISLQMGGVENNSEPARQDRAFMLATKHYHNPSLYYKILHHPSAPHPCEWLNPEYVRPAKGEVGRRIDQSIPIPSYARWNESAPSSSAVTGLSHQKVKMTLWHSVWKSC